MHCQLVISLSNARKSLPEHVGAWLERAWLEPHAEGCSRCRKHRRRLLRLESCMRELPAAEALRLVVDTSLPAAPITRPLHRRHFPALAAVTAGFGLVCLLSTHQQGQPPYRPGIEQKVRAGGQRQLAIHVPPRPPTAHGPRLGVPGAPPAHVATHALSSGPTPSGARRDHQSRSKPPAIVADDRYLDGRDAYGSANWMVSGERWRAAASPARLDHLRDEFIRVPFPLLAGAKNAAVGDAVRKQEEEEKTVDSRLFRKVSLRLKGGSLEELCRKMQMETGVELRSHRGVADEKVTVFVNDLPAREVMRQVARLFGYAWLRTGTEAEYRYELTQDLRSKLAEEELRSQEAHTALLQLDRQMEGFRPYLRYTPDQARLRAAQATGDEKARLLQLASTAWGPIQVYLRLTPEEREALSAGARLAYSTDVEAVRERYPTVQRLPSELQNGVLQSLRDAVGVEQQNGKLVFGDPRGAPLDAVPGIDAVVVLRLDHAETGEANLHATLGALYPSDSPSGKPGGNRSGYWSDHPVSSGRTPAVDRPENALENHALRELPAFRETAVIKPESACPVRPQADPDGLAPHVTSAEVWEAVHRATGMPIVADYYSRTFPLAAVSTERTTRFEALCRVGDQMRVRWRHDGGFLLARSTTYLWDKLKEVPNRLLARWQEDRRRPGGLPVVDVLEMAQLPAAQLTSEPVRRTITHCWGIREWAIVSGPWKPYHDLRPLLRFLGDLDPARRARSFEGEGLAVSGLTVGQRERLFAELLSLFPEDERQRSAARLVPLLNGLRIRADYVPAGRFVWVPRIRRSLRDQVRDLPPCSAETREAALRQALRVDPEVMPEDIQQTDGQLVITLRMADGQVQQFGKAPLTIRSED